jgi:hypothetical protein
MNTSQLRRAVLFAVFAGIAVANPASAFSPFAGEVRKPQAREFGLGPRESSERKYMVYLKAVEEPLRLRKLQNIRVLVLDAMGRPVEGARISVDGGMPQHSHRLPTEPLVKNGPDGGVYDIQGMRFSMEGWWEVKLDIEAAPGADRVTFNLAF